MHVLLTFWTPDVHFLHCGSFHHPVVVKTQEHCRVAKGKEWKRNRVKKETKHSISYITERTASTLLMHEHFTEREC